REAGASFTPGGQARQAKPLARFRQPVNRERGVLMRRRLALLGAVLLGLVVVFVIAWATQPGASRGAVQGGPQAAVTSITRSCPPSAPGSAAAKISMIALPARPTSSAPSSGAAKPAVAPAGSATFSAVLAAPPGGKTSADGKTSASGKPSAKTKGTVPVTVSATRTATTVTAPGGGGTAVAATGRMAEGFEAEQSDGSGTGLVSCTHPGADMWFVGTGQAAGATEVWLYLINTGN